MNTSGYLKTVERPLETDDLPPTVLAAIESVVDAVVDYQFGIKRRSPEKEELIAVLRQFRQELKAVGRVRDAHLIERAIDRVRRKQEKS